jgi:uncharacterized membrane protein YdbT with pleckstrin-like domain
MRLHHYTHQTLHPEERVIYIAHVHWAVYLEGLSYIVFAGLFCSLMPYGLGKIIGPESAQQFVRIIGLIGIVILFAGCMLLLGAYLRRHFTELAITNKRIIAKRGIVARESVEVMMERVGAARYSQTNWGRMLGYGTINIMAAGATIPPFEDMARPHFFTELLTTILEKPKDQEAAIANVIRKADEEETLDLAAEKTVVSSIFKPHRAHLNPFGKLIK